MFYAAKSTPWMFEAVRKMVKDTIGVVGLAEQLRHQCANGANVLMKASNSPGVFADVWELSRRMGCLDELREEYDKKGKNYVLHAAEAGNPAIFQKISSDEEPDVYTLFSATDDKGWNGFMYAARGRGLHSTTFLRKLFEICDAQPVEPEQVKEQLTRVADDDDKSTLLMHAAIGGRGSYDTIWRKMQKLKCIDAGDSDRDVVLLSWAAQGGDVAVLNAVAARIKVRSKHYSAPSGTRPL